MNDRIKEISKQAEIYALTLVGREDDYVEVFEQKFAELIIADCIEIIEPCKCGCADDQERILAQWYKTEIRSHFGVEK